MAYFTLPFCYSNNHSCPDIMLKVMINVGEEKILISDYIDLLIKHFQLMLDALTDGGNIKPSFKIVPDYDTPQIYREYVEKRFKDKNNCLFKDDNNIYWIVKDNFLFKQNISIDIQLNNKDFDLINENKKEIIIEKFGEKWNDIKTNNIILFVGEVGTMKRRIKTIKLYKDNDSLYNLLSTEKLDKILPRSNMTRAIQYYLKKWTIEEIENNGLLAIEIY